MEAITNLMNKEHEKLDLVLEEFLKEFEKNPIESGILLQKFKWMLEKHFLVEEKAIFEIFEGMKPEGVDYTFELMNSHGVIMALLKEIENDLSEKVRIKTQELKEMIERHEQFENSNFYPKLDEQLNENQKAVVMARIREKIE